MRKKSLFSKFWVGLCWKCCGRYKPVKSGSGQLINIQDVCFWSKKFLLMILHFVVNFLSRFSYCKFKVRMKVGCFV